MSDEYISRNAVIERLEEKKSSICPIEPLEYERYLDICDAIDSDIDTVQNIHASDVVTRDCYDRILWENDIMRKQLSDIGKSFGEKMDDVKKVVHGKWVYEEPNGANSFKGSYWCNQCHRPVTFMENYCPDCGADMRGFDNG